MAGKQALTAQRVFDHAFRPETGREPRSPQYREGVLALLKFRMAESESLECPYGLGTPECDAWFSGTDEGRALARERNRILGEGES